MPKRLCSRCMGSFEEAELAPMGTEMLCTQCAATAARSPAPSGSAVEIDRAEIEAEWTAAPRPKGLVRRLIEDASNWATGRMWYVRLPLIIYMAYVTYRHIADPMYTDLIKALNLAIHEGGHVVFRPFGQFMYMLGGTILQCLAPVLSVGMFLKQRDYFGIAFCFGWLSTNLFDVATYVADARAMRLPLVNLGGGDVIHDWNWLLGRMGILHLDTTLAFLLRLAAAANMLVFLTAGTWLLWRMFRTSGRKAESA